MSMFNKNDYQHGRLGAVGNRATIAAMKQQTNPQAMSDADYRTLSNRKWAESQKRYGGGGAKNSIDELWGEKSFGAIQARSNAQASAEGAMAGQYGGRNVGSIKAANMQSFKDNHYHNNAKRAYELSSLSARARSDTAAAHKAEFDNSYLSQDKANEYKMQTLREAGVEATTANTLQSTSHAAQRQAWAGEDRQAQQVQETQAQSDAAAKKQAENEYWLKAKDVYAKAYPNAPEIAMSSRENFERWQKDGFAPNPLLGTPVVGNSGMVYTSSNSIAPVSVGSSPDGKSPYFDKETGQWIAPTLPSTHDIDGNILGGGFNPDYNAMTRRYYGIEPQGARGATKSPVVTSGAKNQASYNWLGESL